MIDIQKKVRQETGSYCGPAVVEMLVGNLGKTVTQVEVVEACEAKETVMEFGIPLVDLAKGVKRLFPRLAIWEKHSSTIEDIKAMVDAGYPVVVDWQGIFTEDEYGDEIWNTRNKFGSLVSKFKKEPVSIGDQGHYCIVVDIDIKKGFMEFVDPYGHYAGKSRFVAIWEFEERWWDDRIGLDKDGKKKLIVENKLMFVISVRSDSFLKTVGMKKV